MSALLRLKNLREPDLWTPAGRSNHHPRPQQPGEEPPAPLVNESTTVDILKKDALWCVFFLLL